MSESFRHQVLGTFCENGPGSGEWDNFEGTLVPSLKLTFPYFVISTQPKDRPSSDQVQALEAFFAADERQKAEIEERLFDAYRSEIRQAYLEEGLRWGENIEDLEAVLPLIEEPSEVWMLIKGPRYLWCDPDASFIVSFRTIYDPEHDLNVAFRNGSIEHVWHE